MIHYNDYVGGVWQQTTSGLGQTNQNAYELSGGQYAIYGFEYKPGYVSILILIFGCAFQNPLSLTLAQPRSRYDDAYTTWINDNKKAWTIYSTAMVEDPRVEISARPMSLEPMVRY